MKLEITKAWCLNMAHIESDSEIGAGIIAFDPIIESAMASMEHTCDEPAIAFGRLVQMMRRNAGLSIEKLAENSDVETLELVEIEDDVRYKPQVRTVYQLANYFRVPSKNLLQVAGLTAPRNDQIFEESVRFAARAESIASLTPEEKAVLNAFVSALSKQD